MTTHVCLEVTKLGEGELAVGKFTSVWLLSAVSSTVDVEVSLLSEALVAARAIAHISLSRCLGITLRRRAGSRA